MAEVVGSEAADLRYYSFLQQESRGRLVSRTGYTGEDGFEIYTPNEGAEDLWLELLERGRDRGLLPAGLGARDTLRLEAGMMLCGQDIDEETTPIEAGLSWIVKWKKGDFVGREALVHQRRNGCRHRLLGFEAPWPRHRPPWPPSDGQRPAGLCGAGDQRRLRAHPGTGDRYRPDGLRRERGPGTRQRRLGGSFVAGRSLAVLSNYRSIDARRPVEDKTF